MSLKPLIVNLVVCAFYLFSFNVAECPFPLNTENVRCARKFPRKGSRARLLRLNSAPNKNRMGIQANSEENGQPNENRGLDVCIFASSTVLRGFEGRFDVPGQEFFCYGRFYPCSELEHYIKSADVRKTYM